MKKITIVLFLVISLFTSASVSAQCSMCSANAENGSKNGNTQTVGINSGILYLLSIPFIMVGGVGLLWYTKFRTPRN